MTRALRRPVQAGPSAGARVVRHDGVLASRGRRVRCVTDIARTQHRRLLERAAPLPLRLARDRAGAADRAARLSGGHPVRDDHLDEPEDGAAGRAGIPDLLVHARATMCAPSAAPRSGARAATRWRSRSPRRCVAFVHRRLHRLGGGAHQHAARPLHRLHADRAHRHPGRADRDLVDPDREPEYRARQPDGAQHHRHPQHRQHLQLLGHGLGAGAGNGAADLSAAGGRVPGDGPAARRSLHHDRRRQLAHAAAHLAAARAAGGRRRRCCCCSSPRSRPSRCRC